MNTEFTPRLTVHRRPSGAPTGVLLLEVTGDLDAANSQILRDALVPAIDQEGGVIVIDMTEVNYIDSVGLGTLVAGLKRANEHGAQLRFVVTNPQIQKVLNITGLVRVLDVYETSDSAVAGRH
jgi:anti-sigma B factor antagonist